MAGQGNLGEILRGMKIRRAAAPLVGASQLEECRIPTGEKTLKVRRVAVSAGYAQHQEGKPFRKTWKTLLGGKSPEEKTP